MQSDDIPYGKYQNYKTEKLYEVIGIALHSDTREEMIIYKAMYQSDEFPIHQVWVRSKAVFFEEVEHNGGSVPRFKWIGE